MQKYKILFLCTGNSARSIIAEQLMQRNSKGAFQAFSAGSKPKGQVHPMALRVLKEIYRIDAADARSKSVDEFIQEGVIFDFVITLCDSAKETCPIFPGQVNRHHWGFADPAQATGSEEEVMAEFRRVRDQIKLVFEAYAAGFREGRQPQS